MSPVHPVAHVVAGLTRPIAVRGGHMRDGEPIDVEGIFGGNFFTCYP